MTMQNPPQRRVALRAVPAGLALLLAVLVAGAPVDAQDPASGEGYVPAEAVGGYGTFMAEGDDTLHDITFPLPEDGYASLYDSYDDSRSGGRVHRANDVMSDRLTPVHAVIDGEIIFAPGAGGEAKPSYGYMIRLAGDDGMFYSYVHLNDDATADCDRSGGPEVAYAPGIAEGVRVERGDHIGWVGSSGNASCSSPHLHFEIGEDSQFAVRHNPMASLQAAEDRGDFPDSVTPAPVVQSSDEPPADEDDESDNDNDESGDDDDEEDGDGGTAGDGSYTRLAGSNRIDTAVALSEETRNSARSVIIVPSDSHAEALVAAPLAGLIDAPIMLAGRDGLDASVVDEIERLDPMNAYLIGSRAQIPDGVGEDLDDAGIRWARMAADDRYELSAAIAEDMLTYSGFEMDQVILALGDADDSARAWPDALSASALAAHTRTPVLLTDGAELSAAVRSLLAEQEPAEILVIGGTAAISEAIAEEAAGAADGRVVRLAGSSRYGTSVAVAEAGRDAGLTDDAVWVATGLNFPDALAAGPAAAQAGSPLLLVDGLDMDGSPDSAEWLADHAEDLLVVGGAAVITDAVAGALAP